MRINRHTSIALSLAAAIMACAGTTQAGEQDLQDKIKRLEDRVAELEGKGPVAAAEKGTPWEAWLGSTKFSGFASASYVYSFNRAEPITGRLYDVNHNEFALNKLKLTVEKPVEFSSEKWDAGYRADLVFGQDAEKIQSAGLNLGKSGDVEQLFVTANVPVGRGLQVSAGKMVTLMGLEVVEEVANPTWSIGNQFMFAENTTSTGIQLNYKWSDKIDTQFRVINGWDVVKDNNNALSYMGRIGFTLDDKTSIGLVGYGGPEQAGDTGAWRKGINVLMSRKITTKLSAWVQGDYGHEDASAALAAATGVPALAAKDAQWWAGGLWLAYDFTEKACLALRADYFNDKDGARTSLAPAFAPYPSNSGQELTSVTLTLNLKPIKNLQVRPELRWDHSSSDLFGSENNATGRANQLTLGMGVAYLF